MGGSAYPPKGDENDRLRAAQRAGKRVRCLLGQHEALEVMRAEHVQLYNAVAAGDADCAVDLASSRVAASRRLAP